MQLLDPQVGPGGEQLRAPAQAGGPDPGALGHLGERVANADPDVERILPPRHHGDLQPLGHLPGQVLGGVDPDVRAPVEQHPLDPSHEPRLVPGLPIGRRFHQLGAAEELGHLPRLGKSESATPRRNPERSR